MKSQLHRSINIIYFVDAYHAGSDWHKIKIIFFLKIIIFTYPCIYIEKLPLAAIKKIRVEKIQKGPYLFLMKYNLCTGRVILWKHDKIDFQSA